MAGKAKHLNPKVQAWRDARQRRHRHLSHAQERAAMQRQATEAG